MASLYCRPMAGWVASKLEQLAAGTRAAVATVAVQLAGDWHAVAASVKRLVRYCSNFGSACWLAGSCFVLERLEAVQRLEECQPYTSQSRCWSICDCAATAAAAAYLALARSWQQRLAAWLPEQGLALAQCQQPLASVHRLPGHGCVSCCTCWTVGCCLPSSRIRLPVCGAAFAGAASLPVPQGLHCRPHLPGSSTSGNYRRGSNSRPPSSPIQAPK